MSTVDRKGDFYLTNPSRQPKKDIADYVESQGILVPRRFNNLMSAVMSGVPFMARSEHPQDYAGASGLALSLFINPEELKNPQPLPTESDWQGLNKTGGFYYSRFGDLAKSLATNAAIMSQDQFEAGVTALSRRGSFGINGIDAYCGFRGEDSNSFIQDMSYSYWEGLGGVNTAIFADNVVPNRYHLFSTVTENKDGFMYEKGSGYHVIENGDIIAGPQRDNTGVTKSTDSLINLYESVRKLDRFDPNHCPVVEAQMLDGQPYFLQYMRGQDFSPAIHAIDRPRGADEVETVLVRGATPPNGLDVQLNVRYIPSDLETLEEAGTEMNQNPVFLEAVAPGRRLHIVRVKRPNYLYAGGGHLAKSGLIKPEVSAVLDDESTKKLIGEFYDRDREVLHRRIQIVSDGRNAYLKELHV